MKNSAMAMASNNDETAFLVHLGIAERAPPVLLQPRADPVAEIVLPTVKEEFAALLVALRAEARLYDGSRDVDPISLYISSKYKLPLARKVALEVLSVPVGEAPAERIFSFSARTTTTSRASMSTTTLAQQPSF
jgi:hypothetical protein